MNTRMILSALKKTGKVVKSGGKVAKEVVELAVFIGGVMAEGWVAYKNAQPAEKQPTEVHAACTECLKALIDAAKEHYHIARSGELCAICKRTVDAFGQPIVHGETDDPKKDRR